MKETFNLVLILILFILQELVHDVGIGMQNVQIGQDKENVNVMKVGCWNIVKRLVLKPVVMLLYSNLQVKNLVLKPVDPIILNPILFFYLRF